MKRFKGFTLIELIVTIAIIGVLAAILVPAMMGWVMKSRVTTYNNNASEVCTQLQILMTDIDRSGVGKISDNCVLSYDYTNSSAGVVSDPSSAIDSVAKAELDKINSYLTDVSKANWAAKIEDSTVKAVIFTGNNYRNVGSFPNQATKEVDTSGKNISTMLSCAVSGWS